MNFSNDDNQDIINALDNLQNSLESKFKSEGSNGVLANINTTLNVINLELTGLIIAIESEYIFINGKITELVSAITNINTSMADISSALDDVNNSIGRLGDKMVAAIAASATAIAGSLESIVAALTTFQLAFVAAGVAQVYELSRIETAISDGNGSLIDLNNSIASGMVALTAALIQINNNLAVINTTMVGQGTVSNPWVVQTV